MSPISEQELIIGVLPGLEKETMYQLEYLWRGVQGRNLPPTLPQEVDVPRTSYVSSAHIEWAPICHPIVEYSKPQSEWTPRMFAALEMSKTLIPNLSVMLVGIGLDLTSFFLRKSSGQRLVTRLWKEFYNCVGGLMGVGAFAAVWSVSSSRLLPLFPSKLQPYVPALVPQIGLAIGGALLANVVFPSFWSFESEDEPLPAFAPGSRLEHQRREMVYGPRNAKYARPIAFAPVSPEFIHPELNRLFLQEVFPERLPPPTTSSNAQDSSKTTTEEPDIDNVTKLRLELHRARKRNAASAPPSRPLTPMASQANSSEESSSSSESEYESEVDTSEDESSDDENASSSTSSSEDESLQSDSEESSSEESESEEGSDKDSDEETD